MASNLQLNETVYVPCSRLGGDNGSGTALYRTNIVEVERQKVKVLLRNGDSSDWIGSALVHRGVGILVLTVGDFKSETTLLDPLAKSVTQFCRLLLPDDQVLSIKIRSVQELVKFWHQHQAAYSHVVIVGHGSENGLHFGCDGLVGAEEIVKGLRKRKTPPKVFISLCCRTGYKSFGSVLSKATFCSDFIAPFNSVQGAIASQFSQTFLTSHLLEGRTAGVAFRDARASVPGSTSFRQWRAGRLKAGPK